MELLIHFQTSAVNAMRVLWVLGVRLDTFLLSRLVVHQDPHNNDVIMSAMASQITSLTIVYTTVYTVQRKHQSPAWLAFVQGIHRWLVNSPHKGHVTRKIFPLNDVIMSSCFYHTMHDNHRKMKATWKCKAKVTQMPDDAYIRHRNASLWV